VNADITSPATNGASSDSSTATSVSTSTSTISSNQYACSLFYTLWQPVLGPQPTGTNTGTGTWSCTGIKPGRNSSFESAGHGSVVHVAAQHQRRDQGQAAGRPVDASSDWLITGASVWGNLAPAGPRVMVMDRLVWGAAGNDKASDFDWPRLATSDGAPSTEPMPAPLL
jgi:hypothetical protein